jgi:DNA-binding CsgD family transcriptional regulator
MRPFQAKELALDRHHNGSWLSFVALQALDRLNAGVIVADRFAEVIAANSAAESIVRLQDGLVIQDNRLCTRRVFETTKLAKLVAGVTAARGPGSAAGRMLVARCDLVSPYVLTIAPLRAERVTGDQQLALILVIDPEQHCPSENDLAEFFGLSRAEARVAAALLTGRTVSQIAAGTGVQIATLRTQLSSIMRKVGVQRQSDLIRILSRTGIGSVWLAAATWLDVALEFLQIPLALAGG